MANNILKAVNNLATGRGICLNEKIKDESVREERQMHNVSMKVMQDQFKLELEEARRIYLLSMYVDMETYFQELNENLISSTRDSERDMVDQRNQQFQTILISATIMLATLLNIMFQGNLEHGINWIFYAGYALVNTISLISLVINIALCILITSRVTKFMYRKSDANISHLKKVMRHTKHMMRYLRGNSSTESSRAQSNMQQRSGSVDIETASSTGPLFGEQGMQTSSSEDTSNLQYSRDTGASPLPFSVSPHTITRTNLPTSFPSLNELPSHDRHDEPPARENLTRKVSFRRQFSLAMSTNTSSSSEYQEPPSPTRPALVSMRRNIALLSDEEVEDEWVRHEREVTEYLTYRSRLGERLEAMAVDQENDERISFEKFWNKYCSTMANSALFLFYVGTICLLMGTMIFSWTLLVHKYDSIISAISSVATIGISLVLCAGLAVYLRFFDSSIRLLNDQLAREQHQEVQKYWIRIWDALRFSRVMSQQDPAAETKDL